MKKCCNKIKFNLKNNNLKAALLLSYIMEETERKNNRKNKLFFSDYTGINEMLAVTKIKHDENQFSNLILNKNRHGSGKRCIQFAIHVF